jgi:hypothetical protein
MLCRLRVEAAPHFFERLRELHAGGRRFRPQVSLAQPVGG